MQKVDRLGSQGSEQPDEGTGLGRSAQHHSEARRPMLRKVSILAIAFAAEVVFLGYGVYPFIDRRGNALLLIPAAITLLVTSALLGQGWRKTLALSAALAVSLVSAVGVARGVETFAILFYPGISIMFGIASVFRMPSDYDPVGHPLLWGVGIVVNTLAVTLLVAAVAMGVALVARKRAPVAFESFAE